MTWAPYCLEMLSIESTAAKFNESRLIVEDLKLLSCFISHFAVQQEENMP
jgi:hypothetical protein